MSSGNGYWRAVLLLAGACAVGAAATLPYLVEVAERMPRRDASAEMPPPWMLAVLVLLQAVVLFGALAALGLSAARHVGHPAGMLEAFAAGRAPAWDGRRLLSAAALGMGGGALAAAADLAWFLPRLPGDLRALTDLALWKRLLAGVLYGGINEEVMARLFLVSGLVWLGGLLWKGRDGRPAAWVWVLAIVLAALAFAAGHLPLLTAIAEPDTILVTRTLVLNGALGLLFGILYWRRGIEHAMAAHAAAHLPLQIAPHLAAAA
jgi:hypothetical protein